MSELIVSNVIQNIGPSHIKEWNKKKVLRKPIRLRENKGVLKILVGQLKNCLRSTFTLTLTQLRHLFKPYIMVELL